MDNLLPYLIILLLLTSILLTISGSKFSAEESSDSENKIYIFYAPWCGHCKKSMGTFEELLSKHGESKIQLINTDDTSNNELMNKYGIKTFPQIVASNGNKYSGDRSVDSITEFLNKNT